MFSLYQAGVPTIVRSLTTLDQLVKRAAEFCEIQQRAPEELLERRLYPDMFPFTLQVEIAASGARGAIARLAGRLRPDDTRSEYAVFNRSDERSFVHCRSFSALLQTVRHAQDDVLSVPRQDVEAQPGAPIYVAKPGEIRVFLSEPFMRDYVLPNLSFHVSIAYALLRAAGVPLGKRDFEGAPAYRLQTRPVQGARSSLRCECPGCAEKARDHAE